jgi:hypothetical protein
MNPGGVSTHQPRRRMPWVILLVVVVVIIGLGVLFRGKMHSKKDAINIGSSEYQALFLTNGQVYFGKVSNLRRDYVALTDIYYLQVTQPSLQGSGSQTQQQSQQQAQLQLVKLGNELHGPKDVMYINRQQVLFVEDLKDDGKVVQAIKDYKANPNGNTNNNRTQPQTAPQPTPQPQSQLNPTPTNPQPQVAGQQTQQTPQGR